MKGIIQVNNDCPTVNMSHINVRGLTNGQVALYQYLEKCNKEKVPVELAQVSEIYFNKVRKPEGYYHSHHDRNAGWLNMEGRQEYRDLLNKDVIAYFNRPELLDRKSWNVDMPTRNWLKANLGSLVMRGLLSIIPVFDTELAKID